MKPSRQHAALMALLAVMLAPVPLMAEQSTLDPAAQAQAAIDKGLAFLKSRQKPDGSWQNEHEPPAMTAIVLKAFVQEPKYNSRTDFIKKGYDKLLSYQLEDGGIYRDTLANYNTAIAVSALAAADDPLYQDRIDKAIAYLKGLQWTRQIGDGPKGERIVDENDPWYGGWGYGGQSRGGGRPDLSNVQMALEALHDSGLKPDDPAYQASIKFIERMQNRSESNDQAWAGNDGGFIYGPALDRRGESFAGEYADSAGRRLRSYGSMTYAGLKSMIYAGLAKDDPRVQAAWEWITGNWTLDENPGMRSGNPDHAQWGLYYYYHTLARALNVYDQPVILDPRGNRHDWRIELIQKLAGLQNPDGSWAGDKRWMEENPVLVTAYVVLALQETIGDLKEHPAKDIAMER